MARVIANYACEWRVAIEDPATLKRFRTFVNSNEPDRNVMFVEERGQIRPATPQEKTKEVA
jgi:nitrite reductase (NADH) large subunit